MPKTSRAITLDEATDAVREMLPDVPKVQIKRVLRAARGAGYLTTEAAPVTRLSTDRETTDALEDLDAATALYKAAGHKRITAWSYEHRFTNTPWERHTTESGDDE